MRAVRHGRVWTVVAVVAVVSAALAAFLIADRPPPPPFDAWPDSTFGAVVVDAAGTPRSEYRSHAQFRSASLVKLLVAVDVLETPAVQGPAAAQDRALVTSMLRASDDDATSVLWARHGGPAIVTRAAARIGLTDTEPPAARSSWGYTATSAADVARTYRYLLTGGTPAVRESVVGALRTTTRCAVDGRDQHFGLPRAAPTAIATKQGWSGFGDVAPGTACTPTPPSAVDPAADDRARRDAGPAPDDTGSDPDVDVDEPALHTAGILADRTVVVVLSLHPDGTTFDDASHRLDDVTRALVAPPTP